jgi:hypothetical protein
MTKGIKKAVAKNLVIALRLILLVIAFSAVILRAEMKELHVDPKDTDSAVEAVHGTHLVLYDPQVASNHLAMVYFVGTGAHAEGSLKFGSVFAKLGYHVIVLDYEDNVLAASCVHSSDSTCFDTYRNAIVTGASGSDKIHVDRPNSILNRLQKLLVYLDAKDPDGGWNQFVTDGQPTWSHLVLAGHSQGSGHAAYIAKMYKVEKVLMFSGPQDYLSDLNKPAPWESRPSATPPSRFYAFLNVNDPFNEHHQLASCMVLMGLSNPDTPMVEPGQVINGVHQVLVNDVEVKHAHGSTVSEQFENVWNYLGTVGEQNPSSSTPPPSAH